MKPISLHVTPEPYQALKSLAATKGRPVADLIREAMADYLARERRRGGSILDIAPHDSGALRKGWTRSQLLNEMRRR